MHDARSSRTLVIASIRAVSRSCHRLDIRDQSRLVGGWSTGSVPSASPTSERLRPNRWPARTTAMRRSTCRSNRRWLPAVRSDDTSPRSS